MQSICLKRGDSFAAHLTYTPQAGQPSDLTGYVFTSQVRTPSGVLVDALTVTADSDNLGFYATAPYGTARWPLGPLLWDFKAIFGAVVMHTETVELDIEAGVTQ